MSVNHPPLPPTPTRAFMVRHTLLFQIVHRHQETSARRKSRRITSSSPGTNPSTTVAPPSPATWSRSRMSSVSPGFRWNRSARQPDPSRPRSWWRATSTCSGSKRRTTSVRANLLKPMNQSQPSYHLVSTNISTNVYVSNHS